MSNEPDRKLDLLETLVNNQKHVIELLSLLNSNVEELILDIKDIKNIKNNFESNSATVQASSCSTSDVNISQEHDYTVTIIGQGNNDQIESSNHHEQLSHNPIEKFESPEIEPSIVMNMNQYGQNGNEAFMDLHNNQLIENSNPNINNDSYKSVKSGLREFSTFVSKMVRQEFGSNFLALTRINELDRYTMQKIRGQAVSKYLPMGISSQFAWNHAMNSLRQLRHRQCKKAKSNYPNVSVPITVKKDFSS